MKKIISFSLWGNNPKYVRGALENIWLRSEFYPTWICRFYCHTSVTKNVIDIISNSIDCEVVIKDEEVGKSREENGMFWRFEVMKDPDVERFIVRDTDSRLSQREKNCVIDWIYSKRPLHIIRDHHYHSTVIMGGMWGATREFMDSFDYDKFLSEFKNMKYPNTFAADQEFLARMIYPLWKHKACIHDDLDRYKEGARKIPHIKINNEFIGQPIEI